MRTPPVLFTLVASLALGLRPAGTPAAPPREAPDWLRAHMEFQVRGGGRWHADNASYRSEGEPYTAYGMDWTWGLGRHSIVGRLYALQGDRDLGTVWDLRVFWHPGEQAARILQFGSDGTVGVGELHPRDGGTESVQTFHAPDGSATRLRHESDEAGDVARSRSFDEADGAWKPRRTYVWHRVDPGAGR